MYKLTNGYSAARLSHERMPDLDKLFGAVYEKNRFKGYYQNKYDTAFAGIQHLGFLAYNKQNEPIAFYGVIPCFLDYCGDKVLAAQSADTMTHPAYRGKGLFVELAMLTFELCAAENVKLVFGFPNQHSLPGFTGKLGFEVTGYLFRFTFPVRRSILSILLTRWRKVFRSGQTQRSDRGLSNRLTGEGFAGVLRDEDYLRYKMYNSCAVRAFAGTRIWFNTRHGLMVGDLEQYTNIRQVLKSLKQYASKKGLKQVQFQVSSGTALYQQLCKYAEAERSFSVIVKDFGSGIPPGELKFTLADIDIF